ncbi:RNA polymerase sigma-54 factor [Rhizobium azooxidifex]|uniref:RNA polymerase sigma-54 factor n=1 Tax=Mycoplana azooxidifex TaxID=1636188 RepID=A0A7W6GJV8_9HYPH|nr:RNA polymerase factor sigma-54 [Mycoplana azooxidifex]MBB3976309.1 RNA polymerase sigma-54 factor [Mycoplana azooxidifex]
MALAASLLLRQSQSLVMTPQLMQSIQLLQMTHLELTQFIENEVERNPLLELASSDDNARGGDDVVHAESDYYSVNEERPAASGELAADGYAGDLYESATAGRTESMADSFDTSMENVFPDDAGPKAADAPELLGQWKSMPGAGDCDGQGYDLDEFIAGQTTLRDHLEAQVPFSLTAPIDRLIAGHLIDQLDEAGYLSSNLAETALKLGKPLQEVERVLDTLQQFDPPGVFARTLAECLAIQLRARDRFDPAMAALIGNLELLARRDFATLKRLCGVDEEDLIDMLAEIRKLDPKPGTRFQAGVSESVVPDIVVRTAPDGSWIIELNPETLPRVLVNNEYYASVSCRSDRASDDQAFLNECLQSANWLTRSLDQRAKTIMKVATEIVRQQDAFLMHGVDHLRPLNLKTVAEAIKMHESTVSRVTSNKYMLTPRGLFELKYFFTVSIGASGGGDSHSAESVRHRIRTMITQETPEDVLSDDDIVDILKKGGVDIARRTVAKYREAMNIPSSVQRRREKRALAKAAGF